jgi:hypothetical protein
MILLTKLDFVLVILFLGLRGLCLLERPNSAEKEFPLLPSGDAVSLSNGSKPLGDINSVPE